MHTQRLRVHCNSDVKQKNNILLGCLYYCVVYIILLC